MDISKYYKGKEQWKVAYVEALLGYTNFQLFEEFKEATQADEWDGIFSKKGEFRRRISEAVFTDRLVESGFITSI